MAGNFFQQAFEKTKSFANQAVDSTKCAAQKTKLKAKINSEKSNIEKMYTEIGRYYYNAEKENPAEDVRQLFDNVKKSFANIKEFEHEIKLVEEQEARAMNSGNPGAYQQNMGMAPQQQYQGMPQQNMGMAPQQQYQGMPQQNIGMPPQMTPETSQQDVDEPPVSEVQPVEASAEVKEENIAHE